MQTSSLKPTEYVTLHGRYLLALRGPPATTSNRVTIFAEGTPYSHWDRHPSYQGDETLRSRSASDILERAIGLLPSFRRICVQTTHPTHPMRPCPPIGLKKRPPGSNMCGTLEHLRPRGSAYSPLVRGGPFLPAPVRKLAALNLNDYTSNAWCMWIANQGVAYSTAVTTFADGKGRFTCRRRVTTLSTGGQQTNTP